jgi:hypothetical protein
LGPRPISQSKQKKVQKKKIQSSWVSWVLVGKRLGVPSVPLAVLAVPLASLHPAGDWWRVKEEEARAQRTRQEREVAERDARARENWHGPRWWEAERG